jgi:apolipoprotein D and lipocalin family protein
MFFVHFLDESYAGIFTCQKLPVGHRQSATILSRTKDLDKAYVDKIRSRLQNSLVDPFDLSIINQNSCPEVKDAKVNVDINPNTFSSQNIGSWVRKAGEKIGDGVEWTIEKTKNIASRFNSKDSGESVERSGKMWMP